MHNPLYYEFPAPIKDYRKYYERCMGEPIPPGFEVHHLNLDHSNNHIENLIAIPQDLHRKFHLLLGELQRLSSDDTWCFESLFKVGGNFDFSWNEITRVLKSFLPVAEEISFYVRNKEVKIQEMAIKQYYSREDI